MSKRKTSIEKLKSDIAKNQEQLKRVCIRGDQKRRQLNLYINKANRQGNNERKQRTHRLITEGAELEYFFPGIENFSKERLRAFLKYVSTQPEISKLFRCEVMALKLKDNPSPPTSQLEITDDYEATASLLTDTAESLKGSLSTLIESCSTTPSDASEVPISREEFDRLISDIEALSDAPEPPVSSSDDKPSIMAKINYYKNGGV